MFFELWKLMFIYNLLSSGLFDKIIENFDCRTEFLNLNYYLLLLLIIFAICLHYYGQY